MADTLFLAPVVTAVFVCQGCGARWIRVYAGSGRFEWQLVGSG
jgi:hypothetical protein